MMNAARQVEDAVFFDTGCVTQEPALVLLEVTSDGELVIEDIFEGCATDSRSGQERVVRVRSEAEVIDLLSGRGR